MGKRRRAARYEGPWEESQERSDQIDRRMEKLLVEGLRCFSQAFLQAERQIDKKKWLRKKDLKEIQDNCEDECCDPNAYGPNWYEAQKLEYECERLAKQDKHEERRRVPFNNYHEPEIEWTVFSSSSATSSTNLGSVNTTIPKAATEHSLVRQLLAIANENPRRTPSTIPQAACQEAKRSRTPLPLPAKHPRRTPLPLPAKHPRKNGKGTSAHARTKSPDPKDVAG